MLRLRTRRHSRLPTLTDHVRALRSRLHTTPGDRLASFELERLLDALDRQMTAGDRADPRVAEVLARVLTGAGAPTAELVLDHVGRFGEVLPTVLLAEAARWYVAAVTGPLAGSRAVADRVGVALAEEFRRGDATMRAVIATGFLDALPRPGELGHEVVTRLPRRLGRELAVMQHA
ncbi:hypothetical protein Acsp06_45050 [Actinomycetospora sp. NBRC 106375]|uniref:hypothetical protein n=1 Tax=Actinomycetospora sp. NBRC 106375 TaxID=3032207 RepID=UPI0024A55E52|nr:hypothetical protein [Actinomycetospora sp. NBRC 106375]GLZ48320.1 hypothetical protein Acsp06_45050 [Actinomycetospora sp. NBRC 106375]